MFNPHLLHKPSLTKYSYLNLLKEPEEKTRSSPKSPRFPKLGGLPGQEKSSSRGNSRRIVTGITLSNGFYGKCLQFVIVYPLIIMVNCLSLSNYSLPSGKITNGILW